MAGVPKHEQPGTVPGPHRGYARGAGDDSPEIVPATGNGTLIWSVAAMTEALRRLAAASATDAPQAVAAAAEAVWWITAVDAAMNRRHPGEYRRALAALDPAARRAVEGSLAGLRFIRSQLGSCADPADFIQPAATASPPSGLGLMSPRPPRSAGLRGTSAPTVSTGPSSPGGLSWRSSDGQRASSARRTQPTARGRGSLIGDAGLRRLLVVLC